MAAGRAPAASSAPVPMKLIIDTRTPWAWQRSNHSSVASEAHGVTTGPTFVPMSSASSW